MFRALLAHPQETLYKRHLVYCVRVMSVGCTRIRVVKSTGLPNSLQAVYEIYMRMIIDLDIQLLLTGTCTLYAVCVCKISHTKCSKLRS
jgi:hypothetical protein